METWRIVKDVGDERPDTISAKINLANTFSKHGKFDEAGAMQKDVLEKMTHVLGKDHPEVYLGDGQLGQYA